MAQIPVDLATHIARETIKNGEATIALIKNGDSFSIWWKPGLNAEYAKKTFIAALKQLGANKRDI